MNSTSWKTTSSGILMILGALIGIYYNRANLTPETLMVAATAILGGIGLIFARDNNVSSAAIVQKQEDKAAEKNSMPPGLPIWIIAFAVLSLGLGGCLTVNKATVTLTSVVDAGMKDWAQASAAGRSTPELDAKVIAAHNRYRQTCGALVPIYEAAAASGQAPDATSVLTTLRASVDPLMDLILPLLLPGEAANLKTQLGKVNAP